MISNHIGYMEKQPQGPGLSILVYLVAVAVSVLLLMGVVPSFRPTAELGVNMLGAAALWGTGFVFFGGRFVRPLWKAIGKGIAFLTASYLLLVWLGPWAWPLILLHQGAGMISHVIICRRHGINWMNVQPREKYLALMEKWGRGDFG